jgi:hypothetical protein
MAVLAASVTVHVAASYYLYASTTHRLLDVLRLLLDLSSPFSSLHALLGQYLWSRKERKRKKNQFAVSDESCLVQPFLFLFLKS